MPNSQSRAQLLFGTDEPVDEPRVLTAGALSTTLDGTALRYVRWHGLEIVRAVAFVIRDTQWGTLTPSIVDLRVTQDRESFAIDCRAGVEGAGGRLDYALTIAGQANGRLHLKATGTSPSGFRTNRTGFVVLHPLAGTVGRPLLVEHADGTRTRTAFPTLVQPDQPALDIVGLHYDPAPDLSLALAFRGDVFEMEDHRNWTDASFKTYSRPLSRGYPYAIVAGERLAQEIDLSVSGIAAAVPRAESTPTVQWGDVDQGSMPAIGLYADAALLDRPALPVAEIASLTPSYLQARLDLRDDGWAARAAAARLLASHAGCALQLDVIIAALDTPAELTALAEWVAGHPPVDRLFVIPARDLKSRPPAHLPAGETALDDMLSAARALFPGLPMVAGMPVGFPELNRNRPPRSLDMLAHASQAIVHAADDRSIMETLEALPHVIATARGFAGAVPYRLGPASIGLPPSAAAAPPIRTDGSRRSAISDRDPRQRGLFAAAFLLGIVAATRGVDALTLGAPVGDIGLLEPSGQIRPVAAAFAMAARLAGSPRLAAEHDAPHRLAAFAARNVDGPTLCLANLTGEAFEVHLDGPALTRVAMLDATRWATAPTIDPAEAALPDGPLRLDAYAVCRLS